MYCMYVGITGVGRYSDPGGKRMETTAVLKPLHRKKTDSTTVASKLLAIAHSTARLK